MKQNKLPRLTAIGFIAAFALTACQSGGLENTPSAVDFTSVFDGNDLFGWHGAAPIDPRQLAALPDSERQARIRAWTDTMKLHWKFFHAALVSDGEGPNAATDRNYGDFEIRGEYNEALDASCGIDPHGCPEVALPAGKGMAGHWNSFRLVMVGARASLWVNSGLILDGVMIDNIYSKALPIPPFGPIELHSAGGKVKWQHLYVRDIGPDEANSILTSARNEGFHSVFNGHDFTGWAGPTNEYEIVDGAIQCRPNKGGTIYTTAEYSNFVARVQFKLPPGGNNGLAIRYPGYGDTAYVGMCECQVLDDNYEQATGERIDPRQAHGSAYGMVPAARGYQHPIRTWNFEEVTVTGPKMKVELNGYVILDCDLSLVTNFMANARHPGKNRTKGSFGFAGHSDPVAFREIYLRSL